MSKTEVKNRMTLGRKLAGAMEALGGFKGLNSGRMILTEHRETWVEKLPPHRRAARGAGRSKGR